MLSSHCFESVCGVIAVECCCMLTAVSAGQVLCICVTECHRAQHLHFTCLSACSVTTSQKGVLVVGVGWVIGVFATKSKWDDCDDACPGGWGGCLGCFAVIWDGVMVCFAEGWGACRAG